jgi:outer membrane receptor for ferrienterochelin and colicin
VGDIYFDLHTTNLSVVSDWEHRFNDRNLTRVGIDNVYTSALARFKVPGDNNSPISASNLIESEIQQNDAHTALFLEHKVGVMADPDRWTLTPGVRWDRFKATDENLLSPRFATRFQWTDTFALRGSTGIFYQPAEPQEASKEYGNPEVRAPKSTHYSVGFESQPKISWLNELSFETDFFYRNLERLVVGDPALRYANVGSGKSIGAEIYTRFVKGPWTGWMSYTLMRSVRSDPTHSEYTFRYDQTHNLNFVLNYKSQSRWEYGARLRYVTGNPYTPVVSSRFDSDNDSYVSSGGSLYSERLPAFFQLDLRIDKKWVYETWMLNAYLDLLNATNSKNTEGVSYSYDYSDKQYVTGLPIIPSFGLRAEF